MDEDGIIFRNKVKLVAQNYNQQEEIKYDEIFAPIANWNLLKYSYLLQVSKTSNCIK